MLVTAHQSCEHFFDNGCIGEIVNPDRCIRCGLFATICDFNAIKLHKGDEDHQWIPQLDYMTLLMDISKERRED